MLEYSSLRSLGRELIDVFASITPFSQFLKYALCLSLVHVILHSWNPLLFHLSKSFRSLLENVNSLMPKTRVGLLSYPESTLPCLRRFYETIAVWVLASRLSPCHLSEVLAVCMSARDHIFQFPCS